MAEADTTFGVFAEAIALAAGGTSNPRGATFTARASTTGLQRNARHEHSFTINANRPGETTVRVRLIERVPADLVCFLTGISAVVFGMVFAFARMLLGIPVGSRLWLWQQPQSSEVVMFRCAAFAVVVMALCAVGWRLGRQPENAPK